MENMACITVRNLLLLRLYYFHWKRDCLIITIRKCQNMMPLEEPNKSNLVFFFFIFRFVTFTFSVYFPAVEEYFPNALSLCVRTSLCTKTIHKKICSASGLFSCMSNTFSYESLERRLTRIWPIKAWPKLRWKFHQSLKHSILNRNYQIIKKRYVRNTKFVSVGVKVATFILNSVTYAVHVYYYYLTAT